MLLKLTCDNAKAGLYDLETGEYAPRHPYPCKTLPAGLPAELKKASKGKKIGGGGALTHNSQAWGFERVDPSKPEG